MGDINRAYSWAIDTCNAPNIGYSMTWRNQQVDPKTGMVCYDCSSFIWYALKAGNFAGIGTYPFNTVGMPSVLNHIGFVEVDKTQEWLPGDIVWASAAYRGKDTGHTEMVYTGGIGQGVCMGAHGADLPPADQVSIDSYTMTYTNMNCERLYRYGHGADGRTYSLYVISAILGNFYQESQINPLVWQDKVDNHNWTDLNVGFGFGQWTNTQNNPNGRLYDLGQYLIQHGYVTQGQSTTTFDPTDLANGEMAYIIAEDIWFNPQTSAYPTLDDFLKSNDTDIDALTTEWYTHWEGMNYDDGTLTLRKQYAHQFYNYLLNNANTQSVTKWLGENAYVNLSVSQNNAIMFYRTFGSGGGGGGGEYEHHMPVWMMIRKLL